VKTGKNLTIVRTFYLQTTLALLVAFFMTGCATSHDEQTSAPVWNLSGDDHLISTTNAVPGSACELQVYIICMGDTLVKIAHRFHTSAKQLLMLNPDMKPTRLRVGQKLLVVEQEIKQDDHFK
jgi:LysM repeat protein